MARTPDPVEIDLLGGFAVRVDGVPVPQQAWGRRHPAALVKLLALTPQHRLHREQVVDLLWPEVPVPDAAPRLHKAAHYARAALGRPDGVVLRGDTVQLLPDVPLVVDAARFEQQAQEALAEGSAAAAEEALASYGGDLLPTEPYDEWLAAPRERLRGLHRQLLRQARRWPDLLAEDPLDETAHLEVLKDLVKSGQRVAALRHYQQLAETFRRELGVDPPAAHQRIHRGLLATTAVSSGPEESGEAAGPGVGPTGGGGGEAGPPARLGRRTPRIPVPLRGRLVGREEDLAAVAGLLREYRLVTLAGPGGAGKSTLAMTVARRLAEAGADVLVTELAPAKDRHGVLRAVAESAGLEGAASRDVGELAERLGSRNATLVLDNCEHLLDDCADLVDAVLDAGPGLRVLATSREPLGLDGEAVRRLGSLGPSAAELFLERARAVAGDLDLTADDPRVVGLCEHLDGLPLAIELAAAQLPHLSIDELIGRLDDRLRLLVRDRPRAGQRHSTLGATIEWSYQLLEEPTRAVFDRLGVFPADFDLAAAEAVGSGAGAAAGDGAAGDGAVVALAVRDLVAKSLLVYEPGRSRYRYLETIRLFARTRLEEAGLLEEATELLRDHVVRRSRVLPRPQRWLSATTAAVARDDIDNVRLAFEASLARDDAAAGVDLAVGLSTLWRNSVFFGEGMAWVAALEPTSLRAEDLLWRELVRADVGLGSGDARMMRQAAHTSYELATETGDATARQIAAMYQALLRRDRLAAAEELTAVAQRFHEMGAAGLERLVRGFVVVSKLAAGRREGADDGLAEVLAQEGREYDRYICLWAAWLTAVADRDGRRLRLLMDAQLENLASSGIGGNWLTMFSQAVTLIGEGEDYLAQLRAARERAAAEGRRADADCVLALSYAAVVEGDAVRAAELVGACGELFGDTANYFVLVVVRELVVRPLLAPEEMEAAVARGQTWEPAEVLVEYGL